MHIVMTRPRRQGGVNVKSCADAEVVLSDGVWHGRVIVVVVATAAAAGGGVGHDDGDALPRCGGEGARSSLLCEVGV